MLLTMGEIKAQLRLDEDFDADDRHLQLLACAAQKRTETYLNRKLYAPDETIPDSDPDGLHLPDDIRLGILMLISHFYENRSSVTEVEKLDMPQSFGWPQTGDAITHYITIRYRRGITADYEVVCGDSVYRVKRQRDLNGARRFLLLECTELGEFTQSHGGNNGDFLFSR
ncbi:head-tail connector protein [Escherichia coli]|uniref:head-tail connector protein n=2 Tax=Enterobacteriaceae TaxID=543 RepID=UPI0028832C62|nr:head-tail connector protein [Escherichia coli]